MLGHYLLRKKFHGEIPFKIPILSKLRQANSLRRILDNKYPKFVIEHSEINSDQRYFNLVLEMTLHKANWKFPVGKKIVIVTSK